MSPADLREEIAIELENLDLTARELRQLLQDLTDREPTLREKTAAAAFVAQFYTGLENILKRVSRFHGVPLPEGDNWHVDLFKSYCTPHRTPLPLLFDAELEAALAPFRKFRHVFFHSYGFQIDWSRVRPGVAGVDPLLDRFRHRLDEYLRTLPPA